MLKSQALAEAVGDVASDGLQNEAEGMGGRPLRF